MSEKDKGFSFKKLFFRDDETNAKSDSMQKHPDPNKNTGEYIPQPISTSYGVKTSDKQLVEDFAQRLQNLINQNNQPGFDFLEFTESLFEEKQNPDADVYKTVFRIAQKIDKSLTPSRLLDSAIYYKDLVQKTAEGEVSKGIAKKQSILSEKETEKTTLDSNLKDTRVKIQQLTRQIQDLQNQEIELSNQLMAIDTKYAGKLSDIDTKVQAIQSAKEHVIVSIVDIEAGIKSNLS